MKRERVAIILLAFWAFGFAQIVRAATLNEFMGTYDWQSLRWAAGLAFMGGALRTIFSLQSDTRIVKDIAKEALWDSGKAIVAGLASYVALEFYRSVGGDLPDEVRFTAVLVAGIFRMDTIFWLRDLGKEKLAAFRGAVITKPIESPKKEDPKAPD